MSFSPLNLAPLLALAPMVAGCHANVIHKAERHLINSSGYDIMLTATTLPDTIDYAIPAGDSIVLAGTCSVAQSRLCELGWGGYADATVVFGDSLRILFRDNTSCITQRNLRCAGADPINDLNGYTPRSRGDVIVYTFEFTPEDFEAAEEL